MNKTLVGAAALISGCGILAGAQAHADSSATQNQISAVLVAEEVCGLTYDKQAVSSLTHESSNADDQTSESVRGLLTVGVRAQYEKLSEIEKRSFCLRQTKLAERLGVLK
jgi:hypothetical protein